MAYDQTQRRDEASWSQENEDHKRGASFAPVVVCDGGAEQTIRITSPLSEPGVYTQHWPPAPTYVQPQLAYYPNSGYQQPFSPGHNTFSDGTYQYRASAAAVPQNVPIPSYGYTTPQPYAKPCHHEKAYSAANYSIGPGYSAVEAAHVPLSPLSATPGHQSPQYSYVAPTASLSASPPDVRYTMPPVHLPEMSPIDAEYSVPCPYRCGTVLTGVHALGNLTRHLKTQACAGSSRAKVRYPCPIEGCERQYARSDGLRVHMRRRHGAPPPVPRTDGVVDDDED